MLVTQSARGEGKGESKPRNKRKYDEVGRDKFRRDGLDLPGQKLPKRARGDEDEAGDDELDEDFDDDELDDDFEDDDFDLDEDDDFEVEGDDDDWDKDDE
jgi:hypothetical protein